MINLRDPRALPSSLITIGSLVALAGALAWMVFVPGPTAQDLKDLSVKHSNQLVETRATTVKAKDRTVEVKAEIDRLMWTGDAQTVAPAALAKVNALVAKSGIRLVGFRPQRVSSVGELSQLPFLVTVEGTYPTILAFVKLLEQPSSKLAVSLFQLASADSESDRVTGTINIVAYVGPKEEIHPVG